MIVETARNYIDTPFNFGGRNKVSIDCVGLILAVINDEYNLKFDISYSQYIQDTGTKRWGEVFKIEKAIEELTAGDVALFRIMRSEVHFGIITSVKPNEESTFIHANQSLGKVVEQRLSDKWIKRIIGLYSTERENIWQL